MDRRCAQITVIEIAGGPISRVEALEIPALIEDAKADLMHMRQRPGSFTESNGRQIVLKQHAHIKEFEDALPSYVSDLQDKAMPSSDERTLLVLLPTPAMLHDQVAQSLLQLMMQLCVLVYYQTL